MAAPRASDFLPSSPFGPPCPASPSLDVGDVHLNPGEAGDSTILTHRSLEAINMVALRIGRLLMESGAHSSVVRANTLAIARAMGAEGAEFRVGYTSLTLTLRYGQNSITRMAAVGQQGVNQRLERALRTQVRRATDGAQMTPVDLQTEIDRIVLETPRYPFWVAALAAGLACTAFSMLLGGDIQTAMSVFPVAAIAQYCRLSLHRRHFNAYLTIIGVAFGGALTSTLLANGLGSATPATAMIGPTLMLVPGVVAINGIADILEGRPTVGAARMIVVATVLLFLAIGVWNATFVLKTGPLMGQHTPSAVSRDHPSVMEPETSQ